MAKVDCPARGRTAPGRNMEICKYESLVTFMDGNQRLVTFVSSDIYNEIRPLGRTKDNVSVCSGVCSGMPSNATMAPLRP